MIQRFKYFFSTILLLSTISGIAQNIHNKETQVIKTPAQKFEIKEKRDWVMEFEVKMKLANSGNAKAMNGIGMQYLKGLGVDTNFVEAIAWFKRSANAGYTKAWINLGGMYRLGISTQISFEDAYYCYTKAAELDDPIGWYSQAYMLYKGLGCKQDYYRAFLLFKKGAEKNIPSCMYFTGLCFRNGYGTPTDTKMAKFWLTKASKIGFKPAFDELMCRDPENIEINVGFLAQSIKTATQKLSINRNPVNQYIAVTHSLPAAEIEGDYDGYLLRYDWSGKYIVNLSKLNLTINYNNNKITGFWKEENTNVSVNIDAYLTKTGLVFNNMQYQKTDHYNPQVPVLYIFEKATMQMLKMNDSVYLSGSLKLYKPKQKEPEKPLQLILVKRSGENNNNQNIIFTNDDGTALSVKPLLIYPNPFIKEFNVEFEIKERNKVYTQILSLDGKIVLTTPVTTLNAGRYVLPLQLNVGSGTYILRLIAGTKVQTTKLIKQ